MSANPTPLDLDAIRASRSSVGYLGNDLADKIDAVIDEVERLRAEVAALRPACDGACHAEFGPAESCLAHGRTTSEVWDLASQERDDRVQAEEERDAALAEVERLTAEAARPAPAWDEEAVADVAQAIERVIGEWERESPQVWAQTHVHVDTAVEAAKFAILQDLRPILAVVRDHQPVKPGREDVARAIVPTLDEWWCGDHVDYHATDDEGGALPCCVAERERQAQRQADAVLDLLPGRSEAEVKREGAVEALREAARKADGLGIVSGSSVNVGDRASAWLSARADRLAAEGGGS